MSKIVQAVNAMISNSKLITSVIKGESELFFLYKNKYKWSISKREDGHILWYYPGSETLQSLASHDGDDWQGVEMVTYKDSEIGTKEAKATFSELYTLLNEKIYGIDDVLNDIISDDLL
jgi:hypothetical protein